MRSEPINGPMRETDRIEARCYSRSMQLGVEAPFLAASGYLGMLLLAWTLGPEDFGLYGDHHAVSVVGADDDAWHSLCGDQAGRRG